MFFVHWCNIFLRVCDVLHIGAKLILFWSACFVHWRTTGITCAGVRIDANQSRRLLRVEGALVKFPSMRIGVLISEACA